MQGFLNAMVYGWTRDDFVNVIVTKGAADSVSAPTHHQFVEDDQPSSVENSYDRDDDQRTLVQTIPDLSGSTNEGGEYSQVFSGETQTDLETDDNLSVYKV